MIGRLICRDAPGGFFHERKDQKMTTIPRINTVETGRNIRRLRRDRGLSIQDVQNALLVNRQTVFKWQRGDTLPTLDNLVILADLFNVKLDDIVVTER